MTVIYKKNNASPFISQSKTQVLRALCKNKEAREAFGVTQAKPEGALVVVTEDMEVLSLTGWRKYKYKYKCKYKYKYKCNYKHK